MPTDPVPLPIPFSVILPALGAVVACISVGALYATVDAAVSAIPEARLKALTTDEERTAVAEAYEQLKDGRVVPHRAARDRFGA